MANVFRKSMNYEPKMPRNSKDMSFDNNLTTKFGQITPIFCQYVNAGESVSVKTDMAIQFKPTVFPLQTPVRASVHFFKVPVRILMEHGVFEDFRYGNRSDIVLPYHSPDANGNWKRMFKTGGLMDYLNVATTYFGNGDFVLPSQRGQGFRPIVNGSLFGYSFSMSPELVYSQINSLPDLVQAGPRWPFPVTHLSSVGTYDTFTAYRGVVYFSGETVFGRGYLPIRSLGVTLPSNLRGLAIMVADKNGDVYTKRRIFPLLETGFLADGYPLDMVNSYVSTFEHDVSVTFLFYYQGDASTPSSNVQLGPLSFILSLKGGSDWVDLPGSDVYLRNLAPLSFFARAYEECYNAYFRNENVDPLLVNGNPVYNKYLTNYADGPDETIYDLHFRNWDDDFLTTAYKSPQLGQAPLVGITSVNPAGFGSNKGTMSVSTPDGGIANIGYETDVDGKIIKLDNKDLEEQSSTVRSEAIKAVTEGISINDFRNVNAFQIWLERSIRRGRKFVDQQRAHTGVDARSIELDMPEFIGGFSRMVNVSKVNDTTSEGLGDYAGQLSLFASGNHTITEYCDQPCVIIGMLTVIPQAAYSQLMPKFYSRRVATDFFDPAFNKIGLQPITYREVCPIQALVEGRDIDDVFGYQIPWYEDQSMVDEVHGQMRQISMRDRLMNRTFGSTPELSRDFLRIDPEQVNDVFPDRNPDDDPIVGQIHFTYYKKTQIYNAHVPGLM